MFAGSSYTLNCTVMSYFHSVVKWTGPDGNSVRNTSSIAVNAPVYDGIKSYVLLRFPALHTSQAGRYTCVSVVSSPLSVRTATKDVVVTGMRHCKYYTRAGTTVTSCKLLIYLIVLGKRPWVFATRAPKNGGWAVARRRSLTQLEWFNYPHASANPGCEVSCQSVQNRTASLLCPRFVKASPTMEKAVSY